LQRQYIGANWFAAPIYWLSTRRTKLFAAPRLFGHMMPIQSAGVSGSGNIDLFQDGGQIKIKMKSITTMGAKIQAFDIFQTPLSSHYPLPLNYT
jgi:hypothetical protein